MSVVYLPLEPYQERYTEFIKEWTLEALEAKFDSVVVIEGASPDRLRRIGEGSVLDVFGRTTWCVSQVAQVLQLALTSDDVVYVDDMFHPGLEALPYAWATRGVRPAVVVRNWAQSVDRHDFTYRLGMRPWMRHYERMVESFSDVVLCGSSCHADEMRLAGWRKRIEVVGLPFRGQTVRQIAAAGAPRLTQADPPRWDAVYSSRLDPEKQPALMVEVARRLRAAGRSLVVCTGSPDIRSSDPKLGRFVAEAEAAGDLAVLRNCRKADYYGALSRASLHLNTSLQDYVSYGVLEASALGVPSLCPAYKSFPEVFDGDPRRLYVPFSAEECVAKALSLLADPPPLRAIEEPARRHDEALARTADIIAGLHQ